MARFAAGGLTVRTGLEHALPELALVRIVVTGGAVQLLPVINGGGRFGAKLRGFLMAFAASHRCMTTRQEEPSLLMAGEGKS